MAGGIRTFGKVLHLDKRLFFTKSFVYLYLFNLQCSFSIRTNIHSSTLHCFSVNRGANLNIEVYRLYGCTVIRLYQLVLNLAFALSWV